MIPVRRLVSAVCEAVKEMREVKGASFKNITSFIKHTAEGDIATTSIRKAVNAAVENNLLKETRDGRYKLNLENPTVTDAITTGDKTDTVPQPADCL